MHVMIDLETWGIRPGCDIRSIGAVTFDPVTGTVCAPIASFYVATDNPLIPVDAPDNYHKTRRRYPLTRDPETVEWWSKRESEAQNAFADPVDLRDACAQFHAWYSQITANSGHDIRLWCKGPHFDISILEAVYRAVALPVPWHYRAPRDMRTIVDLAGITKDEERAMFVGIPHHALDDAISQAVVVFEAYKRLGLNGTA